VDDDDDDDGKGGSKGKVLMIVFQSINAYCLATLFTLSLFIIPINNNCTSVSVTRLQVLTFHPKS
jgi:hypothetical protein